MKLTSNSNVAIIIGIAGGNSTMEETYKSNKNAKASLIITRLSVVGIGGNVLLTAFKMFAGFVGHSGAMVSDAVHSLSDVLATLIAVIGVRLSRREADIGHPYGHERLESLATLALSGVLTLAALAIGRGGAFAIIRAVQSRSVDNEVPGAIALVAAVVSIVTKEGMFWYTRYYAKVLNSEAFMADAWHHRSDAFSSIGSLIGIAGARVGFILADPIASLIICLFILKVAINMARKALSGLVDQSCSVQYKENLISFIASFEGVVRVDKLNTRLFGNRVYIDLEIAVDGEAPLRIAHGVAQRVHDGVEKAFPDVKHIMIHLNPA